MASPVRMYKSKKVPTPKIEFQTPTTRKADFLLSNRKLSDALIELLYGAEAWLFDLDGTLLDSHDQISKNLSLTLREHNYTDVSAQEIDLHIGLSLEQILIKLNIPPLIQTSIVQDFREKLRGQIENGDNRLFDGSIELLKFLKLQGKGVGIATNKPTDMAHFVVNKSPLGPYVDVIVGSTNVMPKPHPEILVNCASLLNSNNVIMVGDREEDLVAAKTAGVPFIGISPTLDVAAEYWSPKTIFFRSMKDLANLLIHEF